MWYLAATATVIPCTDITVSKKVLMYLLSFIIIGKIILSYAGHWNAEERLDI